LSNQNASKSSGFALTNTQLAGEFLQNNSLVTFLNPAIEGELIATNTPELKIKLATGSGVIFNVGSQKSKGDYATSSGEWTWSPSEPFSSGLNNLLVEFLDDKGVKQQTSRGFNVLAIGDIGGLPAFTATPSATPTVVTPTLAVIVPSEGSTMPDSESENLNNSGTLETSIFLTLSGLVLFGLGRYLKKKWH
jgi:hypothetical protein